MLLKQLLWRGDRLSIEAGQIVLIPKSGKQAAADAWLADNHDLLLSEILDATGSQAFRFIGYTTGKYVRGKNGGGVTLQFADLSTGEQAYCIFNVHLDRDRNSKHGEKGSRLPSGQFRPPKGGDFIPFWQRCGLALPRRLSAFHDYMGKLKRVLLIGDMDNTGKLKNRTLKPLEISHSELLQATGIGLILPDNPRTTPGQFPDNSRTRVPDKEVLEAKCLQGLQPDSGTCAKHYGNKVNGNTVKGYASHSDDIDEWLNDYDAASNA